MGTTSHTLAPVSVVLPTWNRAHLLPRAIGSVLEQLGPEDELLVVDDGSTDGTADVLRGHDSRVRHLPVPHGGAGAARNAGWRAARGPLVGFLDSDDRWLPGKLALQRALLAARPELASCFTDFRTADLDGREQGQGLTLWLGEPPLFAPRVAPARPLGTLAPVGPEHASVAAHVGDFAVAAVRQSIVNIGTLLVRKDRVGPELGCAEDLPTIEELPAVARVLAAGPAAFLAVETLVQHDHAGPRLTAARRVIRQRARVALLQRIRAADPVFWTARAAEIGATQREDRLELAQLLLAEGEVAEARRILAPIADVPRPLGLLARLPRPVVSAVLAGRRGLRRALGRASTLVPWLASLD